MPNSCSLDENRRAFLSGNQVTNVTDQGVLRTQPNISDKHFGKNS